MSKSDVITYTGLVLTFLGVVVAAAAIMVAWLAYAAFCLKVYFMPGSKVDGVDVNPRIVNYSDILVQDSYIVNDSGASARCGIIPPGCQSAIGGNVIFGDGGRRVVAFSYYDSVTVNFKMNGVWYERNKVGVVKRIFNNGPDNFATSHELTVVDVKPLDHSYKHVYRKRTGPGGDTQPLDA